MNRIDKLRTVLNGEALLVEKEVDLFYLTGLKLSAGCLVVHSQGAFLLVDNRYFEMCRKRSPVPVILSDKTGLKEALGAIPSLCFDAQATSYVRFQELEKLVSLRPIDSPVAHLRMIKEPEEIVYLKEAAALGAEGFDFVKGLLKEGIKENELALELEIFWKRRGSKALGFEPIIAFGANSAMPHYRSGDVALKTGMNVLIDIGVNYRHYLSDMTRVLFFGEPDPRLKAIYKVVAEAQAKALDLCRPGTLIGQLDKTARDHIAKAGYGDYFGHSLGHGVGLEIHELPTLRQKPPFSEMALQAGMVITIEPGIYIPDLGGVRLEDTVVITEKGHENLTNREI